MPELTVRRLGLVALVIVAGLFGHRWLTEKRYSTPQAAIAAMLDAGAAAARDGRIDDMLELVSDSYRGGDDGGPGSRGELKAFLFIALRRGAEVRFLSRDITVTGRTATVRASILVVAGGAAGVVDGRTGARALDLDLAQEGDDWRVVSARTSALIAP